MAKRSSRGRGWQAVLAAGLAIVSCYGTAAVLALLAALGVSLAINQRIWAGVIVFFTIIAVAALAGSYLRHRRVGPLALGGAGTILILWVMFGPYNRQAEFAGFLLLTIAVIWDWRSHAGRLGDEKGRKP